MKLQPNMMHPRSQLLEKYRGWGVAAFICVLLYRAFAPAEVLQSGWSIRVEGGLFQRLSASIEYLQEVRLLDSLPPVGRRLAGYEIGPRKRGRYEIADWGTADLFLESREPPFLLLRSQRPGTNIIITNSCAAEDTRQAFDLVQRAVAEYRSNPPWRPPVPTEPGPP